MEWEYKVVHIAIEQSLFGNPKKSDEYEKILNDSASDGWEFAQAVVPAGFKGNAAYLLAVFKRPKK